MSVDEIHQSVLEYDRSTIGALVQAEIDAGTEISVILNEGLIGAMDVVGEEFGNGLRFIPELLVAAETMKIGLDVLRPRLVGSAAAERGTVLIGTVRGDVHDIGKNLVAMMAEGAGFTIVDLGVDVPPEQFLEAAREHRPQVVALSSLLTTSMPSLGNTIEALGSADLDVKVIVGGAPVTRDYAERIGADGYGSDAPAAVQLIKELVPA